MRIFWIKLVCFIHGHSFELHQQEGSVFGKLLCTRCGKAYGCVIQDVDKFYIVCEWDDSWTIMCQKLRKLKEYQNGKQRD